MSMWFEYEIFPRKGLVFGKNWQESKQEGDLMLKYSRGEFFNSGVEFLSKNEDRTFSLKIRELGFQKLCEVDGKNSYLKN